jgi:glutamyl-tRNA reductase
VNLRVIGCSHHTASVKLREQIAFSPNQVPQALDQLQASYPGSEAVLLSTCNRMELYIATDDVSSSPSHHDVVEFIAHFHGLNAIDVFEELYERTGEQAIRHLFNVAASLDSMVVGEAQILSQVKQAYELASQGNHAGTFMHLAFQRAIKVARRIATETAIHEKRVSIPSVAVADFASQIFERFDDKCVVVAGAGEMAEETLVYLKDEGARDVRIVNRSLERAEALAEKHGGVAVPWDQLLTVLAEADLVVSATGASEPIVSRESLASVQHRRADRPIFILDLAVPRDFASDAGDLPGVYLYSIDDLKDACERNRKEREAELPKAHRIIEHETREFLADLHHRSTGPTIRRLRKLTAELKQTEVERLFNKLDDLTDHQREEIEQAFDRLVNKILHPPLESLRAEASTDSHHGLLDALKRLFKLQ